MFEETMFSVQDTLQFICFFKKKTFNHTMLPVYKLKQQQKTRKITCAKFLRQNKNALTMSQGKVTQ